MDSEPISRGSEPISSQEFSHDHLRCIKLERQDSVSCESGYHSGLSSCNSIFSEGRCISTSATSSDFLIKNTGIESGVELLSIDERNKSRKSSGDETIKAEKDKLLSEEVNDIRLLAQDEEGDTDLHLCIIQLLQEPAISLISSVSMSSELDIQNNYLQTPLHLSVLTDQPKLTRILMIAGCQVDIRDYRGNTALHLSAKHGNTHCARNLLTPVLYEERREAGIKYQTPYCKIPQDLNARNYDGQTPVHLAAERGHLDILELLVNNGADINARDGKSGRTILHYAAETDNKNLLFFLLKQPQLDINAYTYGHLTPIVLAKGRGYGPIVGALKEHGAVLYSDESDEEEMMDNSLDDIQIGGIPAR